jgi:hypothetical protein
VVYLSCLKIVEKDGYTWPIESNFETLKLFRKLLEDPPIFCPDISYNTFSVQLMEKYLGVIKILYHGNDICLSLFLVNRENG